MVVILTVIQIFQSVVLPGIYEMMIIYAKKIILFNLINNIINWNNAISNLGGQSDEKVLQLTERHVVPQNYKSYKNTPIGCM